jgi:hypothetical protein
MEVGAQQKRESRAREDIVREREQSSRRRSQAREGPRSGGSPAHRRARTRGSGGGVILWPRSCRPTSPWWSCDARAKPPLSSRHRGLCQRHSIPFSRSFAILPRRCLTLCNTTHRSAALTSPRISGASVGWRSRKAWSACDRACGPRISIYSCCDWSVKFESCS